MDNWLEPDDASQSFERISLITGQRHPLTGGDFARAILTIEVSAVTPEAVMELFQVARGVLLYGYLFYPLYALGEEQLWRVCEAALAARFEQLGGPRRRKTFASKITWMHEQAHFRDEQLTWWTATKNLRNAASHLELQMLTMPGEVIGDLRRTAHAISCRSMRPSISWPLGRPLEDDPLGAQEDSHWGAWGRNGDGRGFGSGGLGGL